ncbi:D-sedoheptulose 7-phosphate isomerase [Anaerotaenia torta]|uniref:D-sedoheptulose-7-phosphate isomerase n=1 Tax=Anaerotaenia torta TaxID=433293 RepID=UPI003D23BEEE
MKEINYLIQLMEEYPALAPCKEEIHRAYTMLCEIYRQGNKLLVCGNGGSGADAEHIVGELMKEFYIRRPIKPKRKAALAAYGEDGKMLGEYLQEALPAITLTSNIALSTAYANDAKPELVFAQQVYGYGAEGDVLLGISTSGNSKNVIYALKTAKAKGMKTLGFTGRSGGALKELCDVCICAPSDITYKVQEYHLPIYHTLCRMVEEVFFG